MALTLPEFIVRCQASTRNERYADGEKDVSKAWGARVSNLEINMQNTLPKIVPEMLPGKVLAQWVRCGRANCRCSRGELHGPYYYRFWREGGRLRKEYIKRADVEVVTAACNARAAKVERRRGEIRALMQIVKDNRLRWRIMQATFKRMMRGEI